MDTRSAENEPWHRAANDRAWAIRPGTNSPERARALAVKLAEQVFALSDEQCALWPFACATDVPTELGTCGVNWRNDALQRALGEAVEQLAERYFDLPPVERRARWTELNAAAQHAPELLPRLKHLETALDVNAAGLRDPAGQAQTLLDELRATYTLPAAQRAAWRSSVLRVKPTNYQEKRSLAKAAKRVLRNCGPSRMIARDLLRTAKRRPRSWRSIIVRDSLGFGVNPRAYNPDYRAIKIFGIFLLMVALWLLFAYVMYRRQRYV